MNHLLKQHVLPTHGELAKLVNAALQYGTREIATGSALTL